MWSTHNIVDSVIARCIYIDKEVNKAVCEVFKDYSYSIWHRWGVCTAHILDNSVVQYSWTMHEDGLFLWVSAQLWSVTSDTKGGNRWWYSKHR